MSDSIANMIKSTYKQIPEDKCVAGGGKHVNTVVDMSVGYCLCPEGQHIADPNNPKCAPIDPKVGYKPFHSGFYREGIACSNTEQLVTQKHPWHQNFGEPACVSATPTCQPGFEKQQLRYDGEVLDYCVQRDANSKYVSSYYPTTYLIRPKTPEPVAPIAPNAKVGVSPWVWYVSAALVGLFVIGVIVLIGYNFIKSRRTASVGPVAAPASAPVVFGDVPPAPVTTTSFVAPPPAVKGGSRGRRRK